MKTGAPPDHPYCSSLCIPQLGIKERHYFGVGITEESEYRGFFESMSAFPVPGLEGAYLVESIEIRMEDLKKAWVRIGIVRIA